MYRLECVIIMICCSMVASPGLAATGLMKNEPKTVGGMNCGDTPFGKFSAPEYLGRDEMSGCAKVYTKNGKMYFFNSSGQLYLVRWTGAESDMQGAIKKHGKPAVDRKSGNDRMETRIVQWNGKNIGIILSGSRMNLTGVATNNFMTSYFCNNIEMAEGACNFQDLETEKGNVDEFVKDTGFDFTMKIPDGVIESQYFKPLTDQANEKIQALGLPKPESINISQNSGVLDNVCLNFKSSDYEAVKKVLFAKIGDISMDLKDLNFQVKTSFVLVSKSSLVKGGQPLQFSICITKAIDR